MTTMQLTNCIQQYDISAFIKSQGHSVGMILFLWLLIGFHFSCVATSLDQKNMTSHHSLESLDTNLQIEASLVDVYLVLAT